MGFPNETIADIRKTQELIRVISANSITVNVYTLLPKNRLGSDDADYKKHSFHSPNNNFTGCIDDATFQKLVRETTQLADKNYNEYIVEGEG